MSKLLDQPPTFELSQVHINPRDGGVFASTFDIYDSLDDAKKAAKYSLKGKAWVISECRIVAKSQVSL